MPTATRSEEREAAPRLLCVLGMHRSGTSVVTQWLHRLGAGLGPQMLAAMEGVNDDGFWEDSRVVDLNERLLAAHGVRWHDCAPLAAAPARELDAIRAEALAHFAAHYAGAGGLWVVKDPRLCRLVPFWLQVWAEAGLEVDIVHVLRHPYAVAKSLQRRDRIPFEYGVLLWLVYTLEALTHTLDGAAHTSNVVSHSGARPGIVDAKVRGLALAFETFYTEQPPGGSTAASTASPLALPRLLRERSDVRWPLDDAQWVSAAAATIKPQLRHHDAALPGGTGARELMAFAAGAYETLVAATPELPAATQLAALNAELQALLQRHGDEVAMLRRLTDELMALSAECVRIGTLHGEALEVVREKDQLIRKQGQIIKDIAHLRFWRVLPHLLARSSKRRTDQR